MAFAWIRETSPVWDEAKARIVGGAPAGALELPDRRLGELLPGDWWRAEEDGKAVGYGWVELNWGDGEMLLAVDPAHGGRGIGSFILERLEQEAVAQGVNYLYNVVRPTHPDAARVTAWLEARGFEPHGEGQLRRRVRGG